MPCRKALGSSFLRKIGSMMIHLKHDLAAENEAIDVEHLLV